MHGRVLIADDDAEVREVLREVLEEAGLEVVEASDGNEALSLLRREQGLKLVLLDIRMPRFDGAAFLAKRAEEPALAAVPVVVVSASEPEPSLLRGAAGFLRKPTELAELLAVVARYCT